MFIWQRLSRNFATAFFCTFLLLHALSLRKIYHYAFLQSAINKGFISNSNTFSMTAAS